MRLCLLRQVSPELRVGRKVYLDQSYVSQWLPQWDFKFPLLTHLLVQLDGQLLPERHACSVRRYAYQTETREKTSYIVDGLPLKQLQGQHKLGWHRHPAEQDQDGRWAGMNGPCIMPWWLPRPDTCTLESVEAERVYHEHACTHASFCAA